MCTGGRSGYYLKERGQRGLLSDYGKETMLRVMARVQRLKTADPESYEKVGYTPSKALQSLMETPNVCADAHTLVIVGIMSLNTKARQVALCVCVSVCVCVCVCVYVCVCVLAWSGTCHDDACRETYRDVFLTFHSHVDGSMYCTCMPEETWKEKREKRVPACDATLADPGVSHMDDQ